MKNIVLTLTCLTFLQVSANANITIQNKTIASVEAVIGIDNDTIIRKSLGPKKSEEFQAKVISAKWHKDQETTELAKCDVKDAFTSGTISLDSNNEGEFTCGVWPVDDRPDSE